MTAVLFWDIAQGVAAILRVKNLEVETDRLSRNVIKQLPLLAAI
jgi:hypothetical protein